MRVREQDGCRTRLVADGAAIVVVFTGERKEATLAQVHAEISRNLLGLAVAATVEKLAIAGVDLDAFCRS